MGIRAFPGAVAPLTLTLRGWDIKLNKPVSPDIFNPFGNLVTKTSFSDEKSLNLIFFCGRSDRGSPGVFILPLHWLLLGYMPHYFKPCQLNRVWRCDGRIVDRFNSQKIVRSVMEGFWNER